MSRTRRIIPLCCSLALSFVPARAAVLIHEYALRGSLNDNLGGPALTDLGGEITALGYIFAANRGLNLKSQLLTVTNYSLEFSFKLDSTDSTTKLVDFHNLTSTPGLYQSGGQLYFYPNAKADVLDFTPGANVDVILTRDGVTNVVTAYVNGQQRFSFVDADFDATHPNRSLYFFANDHFTEGQSDASGGTMNYLRVFNGALTPSEVSMLVAAGPPLAVPEAPIAVLMAIGLLVTLAWSARLRVVGEK